MDAGVGGGLNNGFRDAEEVDLNVVAVAGAQLLASHGESAVLAVADEDGGAASPDEDFGVLDSVDLDLLAVVEDHDRAVFDVFNLETLAVHDRSTAHEVMLVGNIFELEKGQVVLLPLLLGLEGLAVGGCENHGCVG